MTARLTHQKGLELIVGDYTLFMLEAQFIFLGTGEPKYEAMLKMYESRWPERISVHLGFSERLEHRLMAGADIYLMPSLYEPCGLAQLRAERYGDCAASAGEWAGWRIPSRTGPPDSCSTNTAPRICCGSPGTSWTATTTRPAWEQMMRNAMQKDFSWDRSAEKYLEVYRRILTAPADRR